MIIGLCKTTKGQVSIAPYLCLGYTDFVILVRSKSLAAILDYIVDLRNKDFISSTYSVCGLIKGLDEDKINKINEEKTISARFEWSLNNIAQNKDIPPFLKKIKEITNQNKKEITNQNKGTTFGALDNFIECELKESDFYSLFNNSSPYFNANSDGANTEVVKIKNFNTYLNYSDKDTNKKDEDKSKCQPLVNEQDVALVALDEFLKSYKELIDKAQSHKRLHVAMQEIGRFYVDIISTSHSQDVKSVFGGFYADFLKSITIIVKKIVKKISDRYKPNRRAKKIRERQNVEAQIEKLNEVIEKFRNLFGDLLFDILRSDHSFFEAPSVAHPSIGSTTKLLLAYNNIVNDWNKRIGTGNGHHFVSFLVTSGGCDVIQAHNLLYEFENDIKPNGKGENKLPVIITIPEASLYDVEGTLFRLAHEFFHLKGDRNRKGRFSHYYQGLFHEYLDYCCYYIMQERKAVSGDDAATSSSTEIGAADFKDKIKNCDFIKRYNSINSLVEELRKPVKLDEGHLKNYSTIIHDDFSMALFIPQLKAYKKFIEALKKKNSSKDDLYEKFVKNFKINGKFKKIDAYNDNICQLIDRAFKDYESQVVLLNAGEAEKKLKERLHYILFKCVPYNLESYVKRTATYIPQMIGELGDIYANIEYEKDATDSENKRTNIEYEKDATAEKNKRTKLGLIYDYYGRERNEYNVKGFQEYAGGLGIKNLPAESDFYSRLWLRATIAFFQSDCNYKEMSCHKVPLNYYGYEYLLLPLYKECFADACALNLLKPTLNGSSCKNEDLITLYISSFIFEHHNIEQFFETSGNEGEVEQKSIQILLAIRIAVVIYCVCFDGKGNKIKFQADKVAESVVNRISYIYPQGDKQEFKQTLTNKLVKVLNSIKEWVDREDNKQDEKEHTSREYIYVQELIEYVKSGINDNNKNDNNKIGCPDFSKKLNDKEKADSLEKVDSLFDWWLNSYDKK